MPRWEDVRPILVAAYAALDETPNDVIGAEQIIERLGVDDADMGRLTKDLRALHDADYLKIWWPGGMGPPDMIQPTHRGRQEVQGWPGPRTSAASAELLVDLLQAQAEAPDTPPEQKAKLRAILAAVRKVGTDALSKVTAELIVRTGGQIPGA